MAAAVVAVPLQGAVGIPQGVVVLVNPVLGKVLRMKVPTILPAKRVRISSRSLSLIILAIHLFSLQLNLPTGAVAEVVAVVVDEVIEMVPEVIGKVSAVVVVVVAVDGAHMIVTVLQARRTHFHFDRKAGIFIV